MTKKKRPSNGNSMTRIKATLAKEYPLLFSIGDSTLFGNGNKAGGTYAYPSPY